MKIFLLLLFFLINISTVNTKEKNIFDEHLRFCGADLLKYEMKHYSTKYKRNKNTSTRSLETITYRPIRIYLETTFFESQNVIPYLQEKKPLLKDALNIAIKGLTGLIEVEDIGDENIFSFINTTEVFVNKSVYSWDPIFDSDSNIQSDFLIIVKFDNKGELPPGVLASAVPIALDEENHRPLIGLLIIGIDTSFFSFGKVSEYFSKVFLHELTHALGFLYSMFQYYPNGFYGTVIQKYIRGALRQMIATPKVLEIAKTYYNCSSIEGVELEDQGGQGSSGSHWEQRILLGDYMGAVIYQEEMVISEITLALLEDSGWYKINYYTGGLMRFGKNQGCQFLENFCLYNNFKTDFVNEFFDLNNIQTPSCSTGRQSRTYSFLNKYEKVDEVYYYNFLEEGNLFSSGAIYTTDYCFVHGQSSYEQFSYFTGNCKLGNGNYGSSIYYYNEKTKDYQSGHPNSELPKELGEVYSDTSFCIMSSLVPSGKYKMYGSDIHPMCYQVHCSSSFLTIQINDDYIVCPRTGGNVQLKGYDGYLHCPDYNLICTGTVLCNDIFDCIEQKSLVKIESFYYDYKSLTTQLFYDIKKMSNLTGYELSEDGICPKFCSQCSKYRQCKKCLDGYNLVGSNYNDTNPIICDNKINVENGYYKNVDNVYYLCSEECVKCFEKNNKCLVCKENYYFLENSNSNNCYNKTNYPKGYYFNEEQKIFKACHRNCETCTKGPISDKKMNCDTCKYNFLYDSETKNCNKEESHIFLWIFTPIIVILLIAGILVVIFIIYKKRKASNDISGIEMPSKAINA